MPEEREEIYSFGVWVRRRRKALDLTQAAMAQRVGCAEITIRKIEADDVRPSREIAALLAHSLDLPADLHASFIAAARAERTVDRLGSPLIGTAQDMSALLLAPRGLASGAPPPTRAAPTIDPVYDVRGCHNPYRGLRAFTYTERGSFAGREPEIATAVATLTQPGDPQTLLFITGASGSGKSSFAQAGLAPALEAHYTARQQTVRPLAVLRPGRYPLAAFADALDQLGLPPTADQDAPDVLARITSHTPPGQINVLILDQCEELFTPDCDPLQRMQLLAVLTDLPPFAVLRTHIIVTLRVDFLPDLFGERALYERAKAGIDLRAMDRAALKRAIQRPIQHHYADKRWEDTLMEQLAVQTAPDASALPLLQVTLEQLFADGSLTLSAYATPTAAGGCGGSIGGAIHQRAEQVYHYTALQERRSVADQTAITELLLDLVAIALDDDARRALRRSQTLATLLGSTPAVQTQRRRLLHELCDARLLSASAAIPDDNPIDAQGIQIDLIHESLIANWSRLHEAIATQRERLQQRRRFELALHEWAAQGRSDAYLLEGVRLSEAETLQAQGDVALRPPAAQALLSASLAQRAQRQEAELQRQKALAEAQRRRAVLFRQAFAVVAVLLLAALAATWVAVDQQRAAHWNATQAATAAAEANHQRQLAEGNAAQARTARDRASSLALSSAARLAVAQQDMDRAAPLVLAALHLPVPAPDAATLLAQLVYRPGTRSILSGHTDTVVSGVFSPDGQTALSVSDDGSLRLWDVASGQPLHTLSGHTTAVESGVFSPDGQTVLSASRDSTLRLWDVASGQSLHTLSGHTAAVERGVFSPDGQTVLSASRDGSLRLWDVASGQPLHTLSGHTDWVMSGVFSPDGQTVLSASRDRTLRLWDVASGQLIHTLSGHTAAVERGVFSPDGQTVLSASRDRTLRLWDVRSGQLIHILAGHTNVVGSGVFSPDGQTVLSTSYDHTLRLWDVRSGQPLHTLSGHTDAVVSGVFSPDGQTVLSASRDGSLRLWEVRSGQPLHTLSGHTDWVERGVFSPDGQTVLSASYDHTLRLWDVRSDQPLHTLRGHTDWVESGVFSPDGQSVLSASRDGTLHLWDVASGQLLHTLAGHSNVVGSGVFSPDGQTVLSASDDHTLRLWDARSGRLLHILRAHSTAIWSGVFSPDGQTVLSASDGGSLRLWDVASGQLRRTLEGHTDAVRSGVFSPDGQTILSASEDYTLRLWDAASGQLIHTLAGHTDAVVSGVFSPDGQTVLSASHDGTLRLWDAASGQPLHTLSGHTDAVVSGVFSPDGQTVLSASWDDTLCLWDVASGQLSHTLRGHADWVWSGVFSPDGQTVLSASDDHTLRLWDVASGQLIHTLSGHTDAVGSGVFSPDGQTVLSASDDGSLRLWGIIPAADQVAWLCQHRSIPDLTPEQRAQYGIPADLVLCPTAPRPVQHAAGDSRAARG